MIIVNRKRNGALLENRLNRVVVFSSFLQEAVQSYCDNRLCCPVGLCISSPDNILNYLLKLIVAVFW